MGLLEQCLVPDWPAPENVKALQTTRHGGISAAPYDSFNLGMHVGDAPLAVAHNRQLLAPLMPSEPVWLEQVHGRSLPMRMRRNAGCKPMPASRASAARCAW